VTVPSLQSESATPDLTVVVGTPAATTQPYTVTAVNPRTGGPAPTITVTPVGTDMVIGGVTYSTPQTVASGTVVTANRPSSVTTTQAHIKFRAAIAGAGAEEVIRTVPAQLNVGPSLTVTPTPGSSSWSIAYSGTGVITLSVDGGAFAVPGGSPIPVTLDSNGHTYTFKAVLDGQTVTVPVAIPALTGSFTTGFSNVALSTYYAPNDGGAGTMTVAFAAIGVPTGTTYDVIIDITSQSGSTGAETLTFAGVASGVAHDVPGLYDDAIGVITVVAAYGGSVIATGFREFAL
jgi:hypothetical protein